MAEYISPLYEFYLNRFYFYFGEGTSKKHAGDTRMILQLKKRMERCRVNGVQFQRTLAQMMPNEHLNISNSTIPSIREKLINR